MPRLLLLLAALALFTAPPAIATLPVVHGEPVAAAKVPAHAPRLRLGPAKAGAARVELADVSAAALERVRERNLASPHPKARAQSRRVVIGVVRSTDAGTGAPSASQLAWAAVDGGFAARLTVASPKAESLRLAVDVLGVPEDVEMVFFGSANPARLEGPVRVGDIPDRTSPWWTPITEGEAQTVEFFVPAGHEPRRLTLRVVRASHLFTTPSSNFTKRMDDIGKSGSCNVDVACSVLASDAAFRGAAASVAQMVFNDGAYTALCSGTLLNDADTSSQVPLFFSANHCFDNEAPPYKTSSQMQLVASTLATLWGFEASACGSSSPRGSWTQRSAGAAYLFSDPQHDALLLRLNDAPPGDAYFSGWDPNPIHGGAAVATIHHPQGDLKKVTQGSVLGYSSPGVAGGSQPFIETLWSRGTTEGGSSGAGLWTSSGSQWLFRGALWGGSALCTNMSGTDFYSRFDLVYPSISRYLGASGGGGTDYTDLWWDPAESGWGLNLIQHPSRIIFGVWYTYGADGKRTWFVMSSGTWTSPNTYSGPLYSTAGPNLAQSFDASKVRVSPVGTATLTFSDANNGTFAFTVNGIAGMKRITRQPF
ncbi:MAG TPA: trypsin-like peptidase domain-containing protein [Usitatibacter sp.]|nr:trypsin-like peptidase domain-containing protein [Usitatibacter sp.]